MPEKDTIWNLIKKNTSDDHDAAIHGVLLDVKICTPKVFVGIMDDGTSACKIVITSRKALETVLGETIEDAHDREHDEHHALPSLLVWQPLR